MGQFGGQPQGQFNQPQAQMAQMGQFGGAVSPVVAPAPAPAAPDPFAMFGSVQVRSFRQLNVFLVTPFSAKARSCCQASPRVIQHGIGGFRRPSRRPCTFCCPVKFDG
jgi:hypothetical protein